MNKLVYCFLSFIKSCKENRTRKKYLFKNLSKEDQSGILELLPDYIDRSKYILPNYVVSGDYSRSFIVLRQYKPNLFKIQFIVGNTSQINNNMNIVNKEFRGEAIYTNINIVSNKNTEKVILSKNMHKLPVVIDAIVKRTFIFKETRLSKPDNRIYCNKEYIRSILLRGEASRHTKNILKEYLDSI